MAFKEIRVQEEVGCNLVPMIDIMFLLLLFFMLNADMSQRELEEIMPPKAEQALEEKEGARPDRVVVNVHHISDDKLPCTAYADSAKRPPEDFGEICENDDHWRISLLGQPYQLKAGKALADGLDVLEERLSFLADSNRRVPNDRTSPSERFLMIRADRTAPYGFINRVVERAAKAGLYKIEVAAYIPKDLLNKQ